MLKTNLFKFLDIVLGMGIEETVHEHLDPAHKDSRRRLIAIFNNEFGFLAKQGKELEIEYIEQVEEGYHVLLGGHWHSYRELHFISKGEATFELVDIDTNEKREYHLSTKDRLLVPARVAHRAHVTLDAILYGFTEDEYISPEHNDHPYDF